MKERDCIEFWWGFLKEGDWLEDASVDGGTVLE
jgi:hypothetical protein